MNYSELNEELKQINDKDSYIKKINRNDYTLRELPKCLYVDKNIISFFKNKSYITFNDIGYDVLRSYFYVKFSIEKPKNKKSIFPGDDQQHLDIVFDSFDDYYDYLDGYIYDNACYFGFTFTDELLLKYNIDLSKIKFESSITESMFDFKLDSNKDDKKEYRDAERRKTSVKNWIEKIINVQTQDEFNKVIKAIERSSINVRLILNVIINQLDDKYFNYLFTFINDEYYVNFDDYAYFLAFYKRGLDFFDKEMNSKLSKKYKKKYKELIIPYQEENGVAITKGFSSSSHYFYVRSIIGRFYDSILYFESFEEFSKYLDNDLSNCDLSKLKDSNIDFGLYKINEKTKLPINDSFKYRLKIKKVYDPDHDTFLVGQAFVDGNDNIIKEEIKEFKKFADFIKYANYDLTNANLIFCDGLVNIPNLNKYNIDKAKVRSNVLIQNSLEYKGISLNLLDYDKSNQMNNEDFSVELYNDDRELLVKEDENNIDRKIYYISDLHLEFRLAKEDARNEEDVTYILTKLAKVITKHYDSIVIITGDIADSIDLFKRFLELLSKNTKKGIYDQHIIFTLGNHELWSFANESIDYIVEGYRNMIESYGFYLLHNELMCFKEGKWNYYKKAMIISSNFEDLVKTNINSSEILLFGGIGFAGKNDTFNANNAIYMNAINRDQEINESLEFENLYNRLLEYLNDYRVIVATHMPLSDWSNQEHHNNFIYVSGHTHKNHFYDDGEIRIYSDNQVGYKAKSYKLKFFYLDDSYDCFKYLEDGIHPITPEQYKDFYYGKRLGMTFNRDFTDMYVIKKNGYYMFVHEYERSLCILNGGSEKKLPIRDKEYYYENFEEEIKLMKGPLDEFTQIQAEVSNSIRRFGGDGTIHGAIVDISFFSHVYVNPYDLKLTYYYALNIIDKTVYKSLPELLKKHEKQLYLNYSKMISDGSKFEIESFKSVDFSGKSIKYYDTDIYKASRKIKQMQKLDDNIIAIWADLPNQSEFNEKKISGSFGKIDGILNKK